MTIAAVRQWWPSDMLSAYKNITYETSSGPLALSVNKYRNGDGLVHPTPEDGGTQEGLELKLALDNRKVCPDIRDRVGWHAYNDVWDGKGSPWSIAEVFSAMHEFSQELSAYCKNGTPFLRWVAKQIDDDQLTWTETFQRICDRTVGLDCNGFVGNWVRVNHPHSKLGPNMYLKKIDFALKRARGSTGEVRPWDIQLWNDRGHIAVVEAVYGRTIYVCQSNGRGPNMQDYAPQTDQRAPDAQNRRSYVNRPYVKGDVGGLYTFYSIFNNDDDQPPADIEWL